MRIAPRSRTSGFTLIEIMIVIAIIAILAAVAIPAIYRYHRLQAGEPINRVAAAQIAERSGLRNAKVVAEHRTSLMDRSDTRRAGCLSDNDTVLQVEGTDAKKQLVRMTFCCRPSPSGPICALSAPVALPPER